MIKGDVPENGHIVPIGKARVVQEGSDATIITYGMMLPESQAAAKAMADANGASIEIIDLRSLRPLDTEAILQSAMKTGKVLIVHEANRFGGVGAEVSALIAEEAFAWLDAPVMRVGGPEVPAMPYSKPLEAAYLPNQEKIGAALERLSAF